MKIVVGIFILTLLTDWDNVILKEIYIQFLEPTPKINKNAASKDDWVWCLREAAMGAMGASAVAACKNHHLHPAVQLN